MVKTPLFFRHRIFHFSSSKGKLSPNKFASANKLLLFSANVIEFAFCKRGSKIFRSKIQTNYKYRIFLSHQKIPRFESCPLLSNKKLSRLREEKLVYFLKNSVLNFVKAVVPNFIWRYIKTCPAILFPFKADALFYKRRRIQKHKVLYKCAPFIIIHWKLIHWLIPASYCTLSINSCQPFLNNTVF